MKDGSFLLFLIAFGLPVGLILLVLYGIYSVASWEDNGGPSRLRYSLQYGVPYASVPKKPHDCEWGTAPIGEKHCSYEIEVSNTPDVTFTWRKVED